MRATGYKPTIVVSAARPQRRQKFGAELVELVGADVADGPEVHALLAPAQHAEALHGFHLRRLALGVAGLRHEQIDHVLAGFGDHGADPPRLAAIEPAADQGKALRG